MLVHAAMVKANLDMVAMVLVRRGDPDNGAILVRLDLPEGGATIERRILNIDGEYEWSRMTEMPLSLDEADAYCHRQIEIDPDCWIVAVDSALGDNPLREV